MGVVGAGKTTVGSLLAQKLGWSFADADDFHPAANIEKMSHGVPLDDSDRAPWLKALHDAILQWSSNRQNAILACSALKQKYRDQLRAPGVRFVYLQATPEVVSERLHSRRGHFATDSILQSQFADLEPPADAISVSIEQSPESIVGAILRELKLSNVYPDAALK